jgi:hypothetical protein
MDVLLETLIVVLVIGLVGATTLAMMVGFIGGVAGEPFERCTHCGRYGLTVRGLRHEAGCPPTWSGNVTHVSRSLWEAKGVLAPGRFGHVHRPIAGPGATVQ